MKTFGKILTFGLIGLGAVVLLSSNKQEEQVFSIGAGTGNSGFLYIPNEQSTGQVYSQSQPSSLFDISKYIEGLKSLIPSQENQLPASTVPFDENKFAFFPAGSERGEIFSLNESGGWTAIASTTRDIINRTPASNYSTEPTSIKTGSGLKTSSQKIGITDAFIEKSAFGGTIDLANRLSGWSSGSSGGSSSSKSSGGSTDQGMSMDLGAYFSSKAKYSTPSNIFSKLFRF